MKLTLIDAIWKQKYTIGPMLLSQIVLIGLITYRLIKSNKLSDDEKKKISYAEIPISFIASLFIIYLIFITFYLYGSSVIRNPGINSLGFLFYLLLFLLLTPFSLTVIRVGLRDKISEQQKDIISGLTILSTLIYSHFTLGIGTGY